MNETVPVHRRTPVQSNICVILKVNGTGAVEVPEFDLTHDELIQIVKYWAKTILNMDYGYFLEGSWSGAETRLELLGLHRYDQIAEVLGKETVKQVISEVHTKFAEKQDKRLWNIFLKGTKEQRREVWEETWRKMDESDKGRRK